MAQLIEPRTVPLTWESFFTLFFPPAACYYATAVLVVLPTPVTTRVSLLPVTLYLLYCAATTLDCTQGSDDEGLVYLNQGLVLALFTAAMRVTVWTFCKTPFRRHPLPDVSSETPPSVKSAPESDAPSSLSPAQVAMDAANLCCSLRGCEWNWSEGLNIPPERRSTSTPKFLASTLLSAVIHLLAVDILHLHIQNFSPETFATPSGGTIFDPTLSPLPRYLRSTYISFCAGLVVYSAIQAVYDVLTIIGIIIFRQGTRQWPPIYNAPWMAKSVTEFWAKRWHQIFRECFVELGYYPLSVVHRTAGVVGVFFISGILHYFGLWGMGNGSDFVFVVGYFLMMGVGVIVEGAWRKFTGKKVGGVVGRIWTMLWVVGWANLLVDAWCRKGLVGSVFFPPSRRPATYIAALIS